MVLLKGSLINAVKLVFTQVGVGPVWALPLEEKPLTPYFYPSIVFWVRLYLGN